MTGLTVATVRVVAMTDTRTLIAHLVTDEAVSIGRRAGRYVGVCGEPVLPGSLTEDSGQHCRSCQERVASR